MYCIVPYCWFTVPVCPYQREWYRWVDPGPPEDNSQVPTRPARLHSLFWGDSPNLDQQISISFKVRCSGARNYHDLITYSAHLLLGSVFFFDLCHRIPRTVGGWLGRRKSPSQLQGMIFTWGHHRHSWIWSKTRWGIALPAVFACACFPWWAVTYHLWYVSKAVHWVVHVVVR